MVLAAGRSVHVFGFVKVREPDCKAAEVMRRVATRPEYMARIVAGYRLLSQTLTAEDAEATEFTTEDRRKRRRPGFGQRCSYSLRTSPVSPVLRCELR
jgi:hypothetical protein